jgi:hypothetical protein
MEEGMAKKKAIPDKFKVWIEARKRHRLSHAQVQMARELGMNPKKFGKLDNRNQEPWKLPVGQFIEKCYLKRFGKLPEKVLSIEERIAAERKKKAERHEAKQRRRAQAASSNEADESPSVDEQRPDSDLPC